MYTHEEFKRKMQKRAREQFSRDMYRLGLIMAENCGELTIEDMKKALVNESNNKVGFFKRLVNKGEQVPMSEVEDDRYYLMQLAFRIMDFKSVEKLSLSDLSPQSLSHVYFKCFKKEYEEYEIHQYEFIDIHFQKRVLEAIEEFKGREIPIDYEMQ